MTNIHNYTNMANMNNSLTYNKNYYNYHNPQSINNLSINLEDLMILEEKLSEIVLYMEQLKRFLKEKIQE